MGAVYPGKLNKVFVGRSNSFPSRKERPDFTTKDEITIKGNNEGINMLPENSRPFFAPSADLCGINMIVRQDIRIKIESIISLTLCIFLLINIILFTPLAMYMQFCDFY